MTCGTGIRVDGRRSTFRLARNPRNVPSVPEYSNIGITLGLYADAEDGREIANQFDEILSPQNSLPSRCDLSAVQAHANCCKEQQSHEHELDGPRFRHGANCCDGDGGRVRTSERSVSRSAS